MQINFIIDGTDTPSDIKRVAAAVLALAGEGIETKTVSTGADGSRSVTKSTHVMEIQVDAKQAEAALGRILGSAPIHVEHGADTGENDPDPSTVGFGAGEPAPYIAGVSQSGTAPEELTGGVPTPPPVPQPPAAPPTASGSAAPAAPASVDSSGLPWDVRIHASTKTVKEDGTWKKKPGVDAAVVASVTAELRQIAGNPPLPPTNPAVPPAPPVPPPPAAQTDSSPVPQPPAAPAVDAATAFPALMNKVMTAIPLGNFSVERMNAVLANHDLKPEQLYELAGMPEKLAAVKAEIDSLLP